MRFSPLLGLMHILLVTTNKVPNKIRDEYRYDNDLKNGLLTSCPSAPKGYKIFPGHCIGTSTSGKNCAKTLHEQDHCTGENMAECVTHAAATCEANPLCHSFAILADFNCSKSSSPTKWQTFAQGAGSITANSQWVRSVFFFNERHI